jgi:hypothetical protein
MRDVQTILGHAHLSTTADVYLKARELHQTGEKPQVGCSGGVRSGVVVGGLRWVDLPV